MARSAADLLAELTAVADVGAEALARLREGDEGGVGTMIARRERLVALLAEATEGSPELFEAGRRVEALDIEIVTLLRARQADIAHQLERVSHARQTLRSYGGSRPGAALFVERLG